MSPPLGLLSTDVVIVPYDPEWPRCFDEEAGRLRAACGPLLKKVLHVGSTAVPGLAAKPIIDLLLGVKHFADADQLIPALEGLGYRNFGSFGVEGRNFLRLNEPCTHHLQVSEIGSTFWRDELLFREILRDDPSTAHEYELLKKKLAEQFAHDRPSYTAAKTDFITSALERARGRAGPAVAAGD